MPWRDEGQVEADRETLRKWLEAQGTPPEVVEFLLRMDRAYHDAIAKMLRGFAIFAGIVVVAITVGWFAFHKLVSDIQTSRVEGVQTSCKQLAATNNVVLGIIDFSLDPKNRQKGQPPPDKKRIEQFLSLLTPLRARNLARQCNARLRELNADKSDLILPGELAPAKLGNGRRDAGEGQPRGQAGQTAQRNKTVLQVPRDRGGRGGQNSGDLTTPQAPDSNPDEGGSTTPGPRGPPGDKGDHGDKGEPGQTTPPPTTTTPTPTTPTPTKDTGAATDPLLDGIKGALNCVLTLRIIAGCP